MLKRIITRPIATTMFVIATIVVGMLATLKMPVSLMPDIDIPQITIRTSLPGASVREVEEQITTVLRSQLMQVAGAKDVTSESRADISVITMTFQPGANMDLLFIEVNEKIDRAMNLLPKDIERPKVVKASAVDIPAFYLDVSLKDSCVDNTNSMSFVQLSTFVRNILCKRLEQLPQTAMVDVSGAAGTEIICTPTPSKMESLGLSEEDLERIIKDGNITLEALSVRSGLLRYNIHFDSQLLTAQDIASLQIRYNDRLLCLGDLCEISQKPERTQAFVSHNGKPSVTMAIIKQNDARMDDLQESVEEMLNDLRQEYPEISFDITRDQTELLSFSINNLFLNLLLGVALACLVLFIFMRQKQLLSIIIISIPLSLIITLLVFNLLGISLNVISLSGLILGVGMIIDNSIIVIDNIVQKKTHGASLTTAVVAGTKEVFAPMLSSVLTTCSVFIPLIFLNSTAGSLFHDQAIGVSVALFASLVVAATIVPVYFFNIFKKTGNTTLVSKNNKSIIWLECVYHKILKRSFRHVKLIMTISLVAIVFVVIIFGSIKKERLPQTPNTDALVEIDWNRGILAEENKNRVGQLMSRQDSFVKTYTTMVGSQDFLLPHTKDITSSEAIVYIKSSTPNHLAMAKKTIESQIKKSYPEASVNFTASGNIFDQIFQTNESDLELRLQTQDGKCPSLKQSRDFRTELSRRFSGMGLSSIVSENTLIYRANLEQMAVYGVTYNALYSKLRTLVGNQRVFSINEGAQSVPVFVGSENACRETLLANTIKSANGVNIPLSILVTPIAGEDYKKLYASNQGEYFPYFINANQSQIEDIITWSKKYTKENGLQLSYEGSYFSSRRMIKELTIVLLFAIALLYFILAAQFESIIQPAIILSEIILDVSIVFLVLWLLGESINIMSMIGLVVMAGIVINDSILKIDTINRLRKNGYSILHSIIEAGHQRLKPILMTSITTIFAIIPLLSRTNLGNALQYPLSLTIIVGMIVGTLMSLFFVPILYYIIYRRKPIK